MRTLPLALLLTAVAGRAGASPLDAIPLPGPPPVFMDYLALDHATGRLWVPAGNTGRVDVVDVRSGAVSGIAGLATATHAGWTAGPSSATVGDGFVYVGDRADASVCAFDAGTLARAGCVTLPSPPDGLAYVASTKEVWVTVPRERGIVALSVRDPGRPAIAGTLKVDGAPEGYAVDPGRGRFYTNLEDRDRTLEIDATTRRVLASWTAGCGEEGPRGLAVDVADRLVLVACTDGLRVLDARSGTMRGRLDTGAGVDNIDYLPALRRVYVASGKAARLTTAEVAADGRLGGVTTTPTAEGCRTVVADGDGNAYLPDSRRGRLLVVRPAKPAPARGGR